jgi:hypothetical protein
VFLEHNDEGNDDMQGSGKGAARKATPSTKEWGAKARKVESKDKRGTDRRRAIREAMAD